uniref:Unplaced genomic scaffold supercont1.32, whole genome shotgun sequence n=1 Tax=Cryptococcus bacillisporus CA1280 TaxID=1296109 RepID=A0A0D0VHK3_CRYGA|nr:hypothetical protein I312_06499 [Cryptococcus bacillisporus CA1280]
MSEAQEPLLGHIIYLAPKQFEKCVVPYITRKIEDMGGSVGSKPNEATIILINPSHPKSKDGSIKPLKDQLVRPYHWLTYCAIRLSFVKLEDMKDQEPLFTYPSQKQGWRPLRTYVSRNLNPLHGEDRATAKLNCMVQLELGGALVVDKRCDADLIILDYNSEFAKMAVKEKKRLKRFEQKLRDRNWMEDCWRTRKLLWEEENTGKEQEILEKEKSPKSGKKRDEEKHEDIRVDGPNGAGEKGKREASEDSFADEQENDGMKKKVGRPVGNTKGQESTTLLKMTTFSVDTLLHIILVVHGLAGKPIRCSGFDTASRHSYQSWHERFKKNSSSFSARVERYIKLGIVRDTLKTGKELENSRRLHQENVAANNQDGASASPLKSSKRKLVSEDDLDDGNADDDASVKSMRTMKKAKFSIDSPAVAPSAVKDKGKARAPTPSQSPPIRFTNGSSQQSQPEITRSFTEYTNLDLRGEPSDTRHSPSPRNPQSMSQSEQRSLELPQSHVQRKSGSQDSGRTPDHGSADDAAPAKVHEEHPVFIEAQAQKSLDEGRQWLWQKKQQFEKEEAEKADMAMDAEEVNDLLITALTEDEEEPKRDKIAGEVDRQDMLGATVEMTGVDGEKSERKKMAKRSEVRVEISVSPHLRVGKQADGPHQTIPRTVNPPTGIQPATELVRQKTTNESPAEILAQDHPQNDEAVHPSQLVREKESSSVDTALAQAQSTLLKTIRSPIPAATGSDADHHNLHTSSTSFHTPQSSKHRLGHSRPSLLGEQILASSTKRRRTQDRLSLSTSSVAGTGAFLRSPGQVVEYDTVYADNAIPPRPPRLSRNLSSPVTPGVQAENGRAERSLAPPPKPLTWEERSAKVAAGADLAAQMRRQYREKIIELSNKYRLTVSEVVTRISKLKGGGAKGEHYWDDVEKGFDQALGKKIK